MVAKIMERDARICEDRYGCHCLLFANSNGLEFDEIHTIFARFGDYRSIRRAGTECGIHFVTYETYEEAKNAVDDLEDHPDIQLKVYRDKSRRNFNERRNSVNDGKRPSRRPNARRYDVGQRMEHHRRTNARYDVGERMERHRRTNSKTHESFRTREERDEYKEDRFVNYLLESSACNGASSGESANLEEDHIESSNSSQQQQINDDRPWGSVESVVATVDTEDEQSKDSVEEEEVAATVDTEDEQSKNSLEEEEVAASVDTEDEQSKDSLEEDEDIAASVEITDEDDEASLQKWTGTNAAEVVVGNVDPKFGEAYLLHLFAKFEPIAISELVPLARGDARYCILYFTSAEVAETVERNFDKLALAGRRIVVQRTRRLIAMDLMRI